MPRRLSASPGRAGSGQRRPRAAQDGSLGEVCAASRVRHLAPHRTPCGAATGAVRGGHPDRGGARLRDPAGPARLPLLADAALPGPVGGCRPAEDAPHDLRHGAATLLLGAGVHPRVAQQLLRYASSKTTTEIDSHVTAVQERQAVEVLERHWWGDPAVGAARRPRASYLSDVALHAPELASAPRDSGGRRRSS